MGKAAGGGVLGPLRLVVDGAVVDVRGSKRRAVLARLALAEGRTVMVDDLAETLWPQEAPESGRQACTASSPAFEASSAPPANSW